MMSPREAGPADTEAVDAVITWVDGNDPAHREKLETYLASTGAPPPAAARATRFHDAGEIDWCVSSILRHAPWFRRIFIVTDGQTPPLMGRVSGSAAADRIHLVDHREIFAGFEQFLPTFNSRAIISLLWRIRGLSERFVYFNDDFSLLRPVQPTDFFRGERMVVRGTWMRQSRQRLGRRVLAALKSFSGKRTNAEGNHAAQELSARLAGFERKYYRMYHNPYPFRRSILRDYFDRHPDLLVGNIRDRLRAADQFKAEVLAAHLAIARGDVVEDNSLQTVQLKPRTQSATRVRDKMAHADADRRIAFACVQSLELAAPELQKEIIVWLRRHAGEPVQ